jgi:hypothetical protein
MAIGLLGHRLRQHTNFEFGELADDSAANETVEHH